ncbi:MAG TPA: hypothetical protein GX513_15385 [Firmicutes bacterium]|nr:hypothetical protein [Bacillota bacterium]
MNYPWLDLPVMGGGLLIALVAITHVYVAQLAVGGGFFLAWTECRLLKGRNRGQEPAGDSPMWEYLKQHSRYFILITLVAGAITGVGIWFTIGLISPQATSILIRNFVWGWAIEWVFFIVEVTAALLYYYAWDRVDHRTHQLFGWTYAVAAWLTLAVINGIVSFMLTPGRWLVTGNFWDGLLNPTYLPSLLLRTLASVVMAGLYALVTGVVQSDAALREKVVGYAARWLVLGLLPMPLAAVWFLRAAPASARTMTAGGAPAASIMLVLAVSASLFLLLLAYLGPWRQPRSATALLVVVFLLLGFVATGTTEWVREAGRKPYVIYGYLYSNGIFAGEEHRFDTGILPAARWARVKDVQAADSLAAGEEVFRIQCSSCHTVAGYNGVKPLVASWDAQYADDQLQRLSTLKPWMPPFAGSEAERRALALWLESLNRKSPAEEVRP